MTAQVSDKIIIKGVEYSLLTNPLDLYWNEKNPKPPIGYPRTSCWRGYIAHWEILENSLFLIDIKFFTPGGEAGLDYVFPVNNGRVKADWFTGNLRIPIGNLLQYVHQDYRSVYDSDLYIMINKGNVKDQEYKANY